MTHSAAKRLDGRIAVVTGASGGLGCAILQRLCSEGATVIGVDRCAPDTAQSTPHPFVLVDLAAIDASATVLAACAVAGGRLDILVNCAGVGRGRPADETTDEDWQRFLDINLTAVFRLSVAALPMLKASRGCIVNIASTFGMTGFQNSAGYSASKAAIIGLTRQMAADYGAAGVRINAVAPGAIETPLTAERLRPGQWHRAATVGATPLGRAGRPEEVAGPVSFLCSEDAAYVHGAVLVVDGGWSGTRYLPLDEVSA
jgi:meso-butanediol dehydrogenase/(S,S)-butanediol dehydrogenase/diacetyl reductase